jgi:hypothetical protein
LFMELFLAKATTGLVGILTHKIGAKSEDPESRKPYEWAKGYIPNARRAIVMLEQTYGV